ncbi:hypothetical protein [Desmospora activa]|uniref:Minor capsid protein n=1 Tax=Desmospora activa DSM 45169 TaxID=1121389 RepID=A0A2T4Z925_9BACL|nr:hypothetical protein [Desmospora activa]PTM58380.1 hypothetical protein C8J48_0962 [Desmospora activa DSM 45169]
MKPVAEMLAQVFQETHPRVGRVSINEGTPFPYAVYRVMGNEDTETRWRYSVEVECFGISEDPDALDEIVEVFRSLNRRELLMADTVIVFYLENSYDIPDPTEDLIRVMVVFEVLLYKT